ncbi:hypothetical protein ACFQHO_44245 [Actinomadura yumaensis]|nr:hypothetical protein [Actinomadura sp. J1-007]
MLYRIPNPAKGKAHFGGSAYKLSDLGLDTKMTVYVGMLALAVNIAVAVVATVALKLGKVADGPDATREADYLADETDPKIKELELTSST